MQRSHKYIFCFSSSSSPFQIHCESYKMENENIVSVILYDTTRFAIGEKYRFCLVLVKKDNEDQRELVVGCSNITKLKQIDNNLVAETDRLQKQSNIIQTTSIETPKSNEKQLVSDISSFDKISDNKQDELPYDDNFSDFMANDTTDGTEQISQTSTTSASIIKKSSEKLYAPQLIDTFDENLLPGIGIAILITTVFALIWIATKLTNDRRTNPATVCYAASDQHSIDIENRNRYLKLQATTTL